jgi:hypothetical protein
MPIFSDYIIYVDESGDHGLSSIDADYPVFVLAFCIFRKSEYYRNTVPKLQEFKFQWFGHDIIVLHEHDIRRRAAPFVFLGTPEKREIFMNQLGRIIEDAPMTVIASVIRKDRLAARYSSPNNPYDLALLFCMERASEFMSSVGQGDRLTHIVCESRGGTKRTEDKALELEFRRIAAGAHRLRMGRPIDGFDIVFADKRTNSAGLQIADLIARPIGLHELRPHQINRAFEVISKKIWTGPDNALWGGFCYALKVFP